MKRVRLLSVLLAAIPLGMMAQDDLYFNPAVDKDEASEKARRDAGFRQSIRFTKNIKKGT